MIGGWLRRSILARLGQHRALRAAERRFQPRLIDNAARRHEPTQRPRRGQGRVTVAGQEAGDRATTGHLGLQIIGPLSSVPAAQLHLLLRAGRDHGLHHPIDAHGDAARANDEYFPRRLRKVEVENLEGLFPDLKAIEHPLPPFGHTMLAVVANINYLNASANHLPVSGHGAAKMGMHCIDSVQTVDEHDFPANFSHHASWIANAESHQPYRNAELVQTHVGIGAVS
mmetsp:Transcript_93208/g.237084  ORF Transcript_93208/g.237084 Transcript_93208/m.237084 type:complete len:227 (+) Transcript_93208:136-816(+)